MVEAAKNVNGGPSEAADPSLNKDGVSVDTRSQFSQSLTGEQQADNLGPVPPASFTSQAIADAYATPGRPGTGEKPKWNAKIVTSWDEQHPADDDDSKDNIGQRVEADEADDEVDPVAETDAMRPIDEPKRKTPVRATDEAGRPRAARSKFSGPSLNADEVIEVEKARDEAQEGASNEGVLESAYAKGG